MYLPGLFSLLIPLPKNKSRKQYICKEQEKATLKCSEKYYFNIYEILEKVSSQKLTAPTNYPNI